MRRYWIIVVSFIIALFCSACGGPKEVTNMNCTATIGNAEMNGSFTGMTEEKQPDGQGSFHYSDDSISATYTGGWKSGRPAGPGSLEYDGFEMEYQGSVYTGTYVGEALDGLPDGNGSFTASGERKCIYDGEWKGGVIAGNGMLQLDEMTVKIGGLTLNGAYSGAVTNGLPDGAGEFITDSGDRYSGEWKSGSVAENGELTLDGLSVDYDGHSFVGKYTGEVKDGFPDGTGEFLSETADTRFSYSGGWMNGRLSGSGQLDTDCYTVRFKDGTNRTGTYIGEVYDGSAEGNGTFSAVNDEGIHYTYTGEWSKGLYHGHGLVHWDMDNVCMEKGTFVEGEFTPTPAEFFVARGTISSAPYTVTDQAMAFLEAYPEVFLENTVDHEEIGFEQNFAYKEFAKNPSKFGANLISVPWLRVVQIFEDHEWEADHTFVIATDGSNNVYYINLYGYWDGVYQGSYITLTALPLAYFTYPNTAGQSVWAIACAGVKLN